MATKSDPFLAPNFNLANRLARYLWNVAYVVAFRTSPRPLHAWRAFLLKCFGARLGRNCHIYSSARIWAPWNLTCEDVVAIADEAIVYNPSSVFLGSHSTISQQAYLCGASHDYNDVRFPLISAPIQIEAYSWVCARATVQMGIRVGEGAILSLGAVATKDLEPWSIYAGIPARKIKDRKRIHE